MNISVIIPVHKCDDKITPMLTNAFNSIVRQKQINELPKVYVVYAKTINDCIIEWKNSMVKKYQNSGVTENTFVLVENNGKTDFQSQINLGVSNIDTKYFSILELDDEYNSLYFNKVLKHINYFSDIDIFLPIIVETTEKDEIVKFTNESVWSKQVVGENGKIGYLNQQALKQNADYKVSGSIIKKSSFESIGKFKIKIKLTFIYEFLLRALYNGFKIYVIPNFGYKHQYLRKGGLFDTLKSLSIIEKKFWFNIAIKEANFTSDRDIDTSQLSQKNKK